MDLRSYRKQHAISLNEMGQRIGVTGVTVHRWEVGKVRPGLSAIEAIQRATDGAVTASDFMRADAEAA